MDDAEAAGAVVPAAVDAAPTTILAGRLLLHQPRTGHRVGTDAVLLAACVPDDFRGLALDVGAGVGAVGLAAARRVAGATVVLLERDPALIDLADANIVANDLAVRVRTWHGDLFAVNAGTLDAHPTLLLTNPPFFAAGEVRHSPDPGRRSAHVLAPGIGLGDWLRACLCLLAGNGTLFAILPPAPLPAILRALPAGCGSVALKAIHPRDGAPANRVLLRLRKGSRAPFAIAAPLVLHDGPGFTPLAARLHVGGGMPAW